MNNNWHRVSKSEPCPICEHTDWCLIANDGDTVICQRVESDKPTRNSGGWIHVLRTKEKVRVKSEKVTRLERLPRREAEVDVASYFAALPTSWHNAQARMCARLERELGLPAPILEILDWRWDNAKRAVAIPMRDAYGVVTGIRYRELGTGRKWALKGSKDGLFFDPEFIPYDPDELVVCEGPTDCAAAMSAGFWCVGRSSCATGLDLVRELIRLRGVKRVTVVADDDPPKPRPGGGTWRPGLEGAQRFAAKLGAAHRIVLPPPGFKDLRDWYRAGTLNEVSFKAMCQNTGWEV